MLEPTASRFWQATLQSGLANAQTLRPCWDAIPPAKRVPEHIDRRLARQAVQSGLLTVWQAQQLLAGRSTGFKIDRYVLLELIGQGGMGRVYLARDSRLNRRVALKILSPERVNNPRAIARFHREALVGAQLQHENLVRIYDEGEANGKCYLVMEYIEGKNIGQMISEAGPLPPAVAARLASQVALGLEHAQRKGLIHRDVNPYNILVTRDGTAKLTDLGLAIDLGDTERVTRDGSTVGTFDYVSPEQARHSHSVDTRSDIYSLGCTLYHMLTGQVPFPSASLPEKLFGHQASDPEPLRNLAPGVPEGLAAVVDRTMRKLPEDRYSTPLELAQALEPFADDEETTGLSAGAVAVRAAGPPQGDKTCVTRQFPSPPPDDPLGLGINLNLNAGGSAPGPSASTSPAPDAAPEAVPAPAAGPAPEAAPQGPGLAALLAASDDAPFDLGLKVDTGPEPPLSRTSSSARLKAARPQAPAPEAPAKPRVTGRKPWLVPAAATLGALVIAAGAALAYRTAGGPATAPDGKGQGKGGSVEAVASPTGAGGGKTSGEKAPEVPQPKGQQVAVVAADGTTSIEPDLRAAMRAAVGSRGHVLLLNQTPLKVAASEAFTASGGTLAIRAGAGVKPVLQVEVKGATPFLSTRTNAPLKIEGVTIEVTYVEPGPAPAPVIQAGSSVSLDRCTFKLTNPTAGSRALSVEGGRLTASGCWFADFDRALDVACFGGSSATLRQCLLVRTKGGDKAPGGWAVRLQNMPGGTAGVARRLELERCTSFGQGFLEVSGFSPTAPLSVKLTGCAVVADTLLSWQPSAPADPKAREARPTREALPWAGRDDQFDVRGTGGWVRFVAAPGAAPVPLPDGPTDLASWNRDFATETNSVPPPVRFATDPASLSEHPEPSNFAIADLGIRPVGADPALIGPGADPVPPASSRP